MKKNFLTFFTLFVFIFSVFACTKETNDSSGNLCSNITPASKLVKKIKHKDQEIYFYYTLDKIDSIIFNYNDSLNPIKPLRKCYFKYNNECLINYYKEIDYRNDPSGIELGDFEIVYDKNQNPILCKGGGKEQTYNFTVNELSIDKGMGEIDTINYYKDNFEIVDGNLVNEKEFGNLVKSYKYDTKLNPLRLIRNLDKISAIVFENLTFKNDELISLKLSKNNVIEINSYEMNNLSMIENITIDYNMNDLPIRYKSKIKNLNNTDSLEYIKASFEY
jgi:hypothetical protein